MKQLREHLAACGKTQSDLAAELGCSRSFLSEVMAGKKMPSLRLALRIEAATAGAVPASSWVAPPAAGEDAA